jgi:hypothetical protein
MSSNQGLALVPRGDLRSAKEDPGIPPKAATTLCARGQLCSTLFPRGRPKRRRFNLRKPRHNLSSASARPRLKMRILCHISALPLVNVTQTSHPSGVPRKISPRVRGLVQLSRLSMKREHPLPMDKTLDSPGLSWYTTWDAEGISARRRRTCKKLPG